MGGQIALVRVLGGAIHRAVQHGLGTSLRMVIAVTWNTDDMRRP
jgi:hypothetical protein